MLSPLIKFHPFHGSSTNVGTFGSLLFPRWPNPSLEVDFSERRFQEEPWLASPWEHANSKSGCSIVSECQHLTVG